MSELITSSSAVKDELITITKATHDDLTLIKTDLEKLYKLQEKLNHALPNNFYEDYLSTEYTRNIDLEIEIVVSDLSDEINKFAININSLTTVQIPLINIYELRTSPINFRNIFNISRSTLNKAIEVSKKYKNNDIMNIINGIQQHYTLQNVLNDYSELFNRKLDLLPLLENEKNTFIKGNSLIESWIKEIDDIKGKTLQEYSQTILEEKNLVIKKFEHEAKSLLNRFNTNLKGLELDVKSALESTNLMKTTVDAGLKTLATLNERTQKLEVEFSSIISEKTKLIEGEIDSEKEKINVQLNAIRSFTLTKSNKLKNAQKDFIRLVERAGIYELTQNYSKKADEEKQEYKDYRRNTIISIIAAIGWTILIFVLAIFDRPSTPFDFVSFLWQPAPSHPIDYFLLLARLSVSLMFFVLALYLSKQASKHYECYQDNHRTFLQLAALEPFMARMSEDEQKTIRKGLIPTYFNQNPDSKFAQTGDDVGLPASFNTPIEKLVDLLKPVLEKSSESSKPN